VEVALDKYEFNSTTTVMLPKGQVMGELVLWQCIHSNIGNWNWQCRGVGAVVFQLLCWWWIFWEATFILKRPRTAVED
jgi:hypothetical protein